MRLKKKFFVFAIIAIMISLLCQMTYAYYTTTAVAANEISTGGVQIELLEKTADGKDFADVEGVMPGAVISKIVTVSNKQDDVFVRVTVDVSVLDQDGKELTITDAQLSDMLFIDYNTKNWTQKDGVWYYNGILSGGKMTEPLFTEVFFDPDGLSNEYQSVSISMGIQAQATQSANNGTDPLTAAGWPEA